MRWLVAPLIASVFIACQCGTGSLCEGTRCGPGLTCDERTGGCVIDSNSPVLTGGGSTSATGGGTASTGGGSSSVGGGSGSTGGGSESGGGTASTGGGSATCAMTCSGATPFCEGGRCVTCTDTQGCSGATPVCNRLWQGGIGRCQVCTDDHRGCSGASPFCDVTIQPAAGCIGCRSSGDCTVAGTVCDVANTRTCVVNDGGFGGGSSGGGTVVWGDGGVTQRCLPGGSMPGTRCTSECERGYVCQNGTCVLRGSTGPIQVTLRFPDAEDLDLYVVEPVANGTCEIFYSQPGVNPTPPPIPLPFPLPQPRSCGAKGWLDLDSNAACRIDNVNIENIIYSPGVTPTRGRYVVRVNYYQNCSASRAVPFEVEVRANGQTRYFCDSFQPNQANGGSLGAGRFIADFTIP